MYRICRSLIVASMCLFISACSTQDNRFIEEKKVDQNSSETITSTKNDTTIVDTAAAKTTYNEKNSDAPNEKKILAKDMNNDGKYDFFDNNDDGVLDDNDYRMNVYGNTDEPGIVFPEFTFTDINGNTYDYDTIRNNKLTVIDLFTDWCPDCYRLNYGLAHYRMTEDSDPINYFNNMPDGVGWISVCLESPYFTVSNLPAFKEQIINYCKTTGKPDNVILGDQETFDFFVNIRTYKTDIRDYAHTIPATFIVDTDGNILKVIYEGSAKQVVNEIENELNHYQISQKQE